MVGVSRWALCVFQGGGALLPHVRPGRHLCLHRCLLRALVGARSHTHTPTHSCSPSPSRCLALRQVEPTRVGPGGVPHALAGVANGGRRDVLRLQLPRKVRRPKAPSPKGAGPTTPA